MGFIAFIINAFWVQEVKAGRGRPKGVMSNINLESLHPAPILVVGGGVAAVGVGVVGVAVGVAVVWSLEGAVVTPAISGGWCLASPPREPFFDTLNAIHNLPHIIIVPNSLYNQWYSELRTFFVPKAVEIYKYPTAENEFGEFFSGP
ncbi:hypothetical protein BDR03DRAFT_1019049 [Suillus americanus]|nr:hypothetical protein BDR03DRAFT_1019049 [Suillus americanus]